jgi:prenyltransferase beta subunit
VSWPLASFAIVAGVLLVGWLAYERARPSARMVAVVATLAAIAALGRDAFVALPDVKPITAMTLVVGYALGPLPGFAVGAIGMLASNIMLGQGPYTPWQMAAWGLVGLAGALLGRLSGRRVGRVGLALACAVMALAAKEIMNIYTWTVGAAHTPAALLATASAALPFDITDAVASFLFGLAFAPELARLLGRMRARMDVVWEPAHPPTHPPAGAAPLAMAVLAMVGMGMLSSSPGAAHATDGNTSTARTTRIVVSSSTVSSSAGAVQARVDVAREISFLARAQNSDGGFGAAPRQRSSELYSAWIAMGLAAAGRDPLSLTHAGHSVLDAIRGEASTLEGTGDQERTILALRACGVSTHAFPGGDPVTKLLRARATDGSFGRLVNITTFAIFALRAAGRPASDPVVRAAGSWLEAQQHPDGGFSFTSRGGGEDVDDTAAALQGVIDAGGLRSPVVTRAVAFLRRTQNPDGGYPQQVGGESNAQSTAWAAQGLVAAGQNASAVKRQGSRSPLAYLESLLGPDGSVRYSRTSPQTPVWVTAQVLTALAGKPFPISPVPRRPIARHTSVPSARTQSRTISSARTTQHARVPVPRGRRSGPTLNAGHTDAATVRAAAQARLDKIALMVGMLVGIVLAPELR